MVPREIVAGAKPYSNLVVAGMHAPVKGEIGCPGFWIVGKKYPGGNVGGCIFAVVGQLG